jgi:hypothetical protein
VRLVARGSIHATFWPAALGSAPYRSGPSRDWLEVKNPDSLAIIRVREAGGEFRRSQV